LSEIASNFALFWPVDSFPGKGLQILNPHKAQANCDHVAKFPNDQQAELGLGDLALKKNLR